VRNCSTSFARINELLEAKDKRLQPSSVQPVSKGNGVFQIAYDETLLVASLPSQ